MRLASLPDFSVCSSYELIYLVFVHIGIAIEYQLTASLVLQAYEKGLMIAIIPFTSKVSFTNKCCEWGGFNRE